MSASGDPFDELVDRIVAAPTSRSVVALWEAHRGLWAPEHEAVATLRQRQIAAAMFDVETLADAAREEVASIEEQLADARGRGDSTSATHERDRARGWRRLLAWTTTLARLPLADLDWPCPVCEVASGVPCDLPDREDAWTEPGPRFHFDRGWCRSWGSTRPEGVAGCWPTVVGGPAHTHRGECLGCAWVGPLRAGRDSEHDGVHDAHDHAWAGWRDLPVVPRPPRSETNPKQAAKVEARWRREVAGMLPEGWLERGGPIRTERVRPGTRDVPNGAPGGGYDIAVVLEAPRGATLHDLEDPEPANEVVVSTTRRTCAASGHLRRKNPEGSEVVYRGRTYCRCGRASYAPTELDQAS